MEDRLEIDVARLRSEGETFEGVLDDSVLEMDGDPLIHPFAGLRYNMFVRLLGGELLVRGRLEQDFEAVCSRCGADFDFTATVDDFTESYPVDEKTEFVDLTDELRQSIILALPNYPICRSDCRGVCPHCRKNLNEGDCGCVPDERDGRWAALDALAPDGEDQGRKEGEKRNGIT